MNSINKIDFIVYLRCLMLVLVIIGHGLIVYTSFWANHVMPIDNALWRYVVYVLYAIHMPIFSMIAGYLYIYIRRKGGYGSFKKLISKKIKRILVPLLFWGTFECTVDLNGNFCELLWGPLHLWYLRFLLMSFFITYLYDKWIIKKPWIILPIILLFIIKLMLFKDIYSDVFFDYYHYFLIGMGIQIITTRYNNYRNIVYLFMSCLLFSYLCYSVSNKFDGLLLGIMLNISIFLAFWVTKLPPPGKLLLNLDKNSMGIYLIHHPIIWNIVATAWGRDYLEHYSYVVAPMLCIFTFIFSWLLSNYVFNIKYLRFLVGQST